MEVQDGASETMRNATEGCALWRGAMTDENSKRQSKRRGIGENRSSAGFVAQRLFDITVKNLNQVFGSARFAGVHFGGLAEDMITNFAVNDFDKQTIDGAAARGNLLQHRGALALLFQSGADTFDLAFDAVDTSEKFAAFLDGVGHS
jgi:hypothetical protein